MPSGRGKYGSDVATEVPFLVQSAAPVMPLLEPHPMSRFNYTDRPCRNVAFLFIFLLAMSATVGGGVYAFYHRNPNFYVLNSSEVLNDAVNCPIRSPPTNHSFTLFESGSERLPFPDPAEWEKLFDMDALLKFFAPPLLATILVSFILGVLYLSLLRIIPSIVLYSTVIMMVAAPAVLGVIAYNVIDVRELSTNQVMIGWGVLAAITLLELIFFYFVRSKLELSCKLLGVAAVGLDNNMALLFFVPALNILLLFLIIPLAGLIGLAYTNGELMRNPHAMDGVCGVQAKRVCCQWKYDEWVPYYMGWTAFSIVWIIMLVFEIRVYTVGGTISQWYFALSGSSRRSRVSLCTSFGHAVGPSLGTLCIASFILSLLQAVREFMERFKREPEHRRSSLCECLCCCLECLFEIVECISKFATITAAITGEGFWEATRSASWLLKQSLLSVAVVDRLSVVVLNSAAFVLALIWGVLLGIFCYFNWKHNPVPGFTEDEALPLAAMEGALAFLIIFIVLHFFATVMLNVVDAVYICYAIDKYGGALTMPAVHEVYRQVPLAKGGRYQGLQQEDEGWVIPDERDYYNDYDYQPQTLPQYDPSPYPTEAPEQFSPVYDDYGMGGQYMDPGRQAIMAMEDDERSAGGGGAMTTGMRFPVRRVHYGT